jgi:hypothetical protein
MKVIKFNEFIKESDDFRDPPEEYIKIALMKLKKKIEGFFEEVDPEEVTTMSKALERGAKKDKNDISFKELNVSLESCELSKYSAVYDSLKIIFSDPDFRYDLYITIPLEEAVVGEEDEDKKIETCSYKFKKYDINKNFELIGQIGPKKIDIDKINEEFLVSLKIDLDDEFGEKEELEFET